jgi:hypothetical protein
MSVWISIATAIAIGFQGWIVVRRFGVPLAVAAS